jgi:hypothetical protein
MGQGHDIVEWAKDYRLAYPDATANMLEDALRERFLGDARAHSLSDRLSGVSGALDYVGFPGSGMAVFVVVRMREWLFPLDRDLIYNQIKAAVQIALQADMAEHRDRTTRRAIQHGVFYGVGNLGIALAMVAAWQLDVMESLVWPAMLFAVYGIMGLSLAGWKWRRWRRSPRVVQQPNVTATSVSDPPAL